MRDTYTALVSLLLPVLTQHRGDHARVRRWQLPLLGFSECLERLARELQAPFLRGKEAVSELRLCISKVQVACIWLRRVSEPRSWALEAGGSNV